MAWNNAAGLHADPLGGRGETADGIGQHRCSRRGVGLQILIGVDQHALHLGPKALHNMQGLGLVAQGLQAFVFRAHAYAAATGQQ